MTSAAIEITAEFLTLVGMVVLVSVQWGVLMGRVSSIERRLNQIEKHCETRQCFADLKLGKISQ